MEVIWNTWNTYSHSRLPPGPLSFQRYSSKRCRRGEKEGMSVSHVFMIVPIMVELGELRPGGPAQYAAGQTTDHMSNSDQIQTRGRTRRLRGATSRRLAQSKRSLSSTPPLCRPGGKRSRDCSALQRRRRARHVPGSMPLSNGERTWRRWPSRPKRQHGRSPRK